MLPIVEMRGITKRFGEVQALDGADLVLHRGEIHALLGENGAGKTTLMNILSGLYRPDAGTIAVEGRPVTIAAPRDALRAGIGMVHQHFELVPPFTVLENIILGREGSPWLRRAAARAAVQALADRYGIALDLDARVRGLAVGVQQKVEILKALYRGVRVLILDEPTTLLAPQEVDTLFGTIAEFTAQGLTVVFITHKIREALAVSARITVMRRGRAVATRLRAEADERELVRLMVGELSRTTADPAPPPGRGGPPALAVADLVVADDRGGRAVAGCTFAVHPGEIVGVAGVAGNGQKELGEAIIGLRPALSGTITLGGADVRRWPVRARLAGGLAVIPEDRLRDGILPGMSLDETLVLGPHQFMFPRGRYDRGRALAAARAAIAEYGIAAPDARLPSAHLSGGNIQKLLAARAFLLAAHAGSRVLLAMHPTRGLDVRATEFLHGRLRAFARAGGAVLLVSEDLDELMALCDRLLVLYRGAIAGAFERPAFDPYRIGAAAAGAVQR
ncbi:MAG TPA: ABC transporter ATP-binding protein [bacterium]|nr:ABC transporter ATP-binding protein [bacterium]